MTEHRDSPETEPTGAHEVRPASQGRLAALLEEATPRRVSLPKLAMAAGLAVLVLFGVSRLARSVTAWVAALPDQQIRFSDIELVPEPDSWVIGARSRILEQVRDVANLAEKLPLLELNLEETGKAFRLCPWIKDVVRVERPHGRLVVRLVYRKPVAVVVLDKDGENTYVIDENGVPLPPGDIDWTLKGPRFKVRGMADPLIEIRGVASATAPRFGVPWKRTEGDDPDPMVLGAARLAEFLQRQPRTMPSGRPAPEFVKIHLPGEPNNILFLLDSDQNWLAWGKPPGEEKPGDPSAEGRWTMLLDWVDRTGPLNAKSPNFLKFTRSGVEFVGGISRKLK